jgi:hypothetical protein
MSAPSIKGSAFQAVIDDLNQLVASGALGEAELAARLEPGDRELLRAGIQTGSWYAIESYRRMLALLVAKEGRADREGYLRRRGRAAAERILKMGLYSHLEAAMRAAERAPERWVEQVGRVMTTLSPAMFNFSSWEFVPGDAAKLFSLHVRQAALLPDETRILLQSFIEALFEPFTQDPVRVVSRRPSPDEIVFEGTWAGRSGARSETRS